MNSITRLVLAALLALTAAAPAETLPEGYRFDATRYYADNLTEAEAMKEGRALATKDVEAKLYRRLVYGRQSSAILEESDYLYGKYRVVLVTIAGCCVTPGILGVAKGYNEVMDKHFSTLFDHDIFKEAADAVRQQRASKTQPPPKT